MSTEAKTRPSVDYLRRAFDGCRASGGVADDAMAVRGTYLAVAAHALGGEGGPSEVHRIAGVLDSVDGNGDSRWRTAAAAISAEAFEDVASAWTTPDRNVSNVHHWLRIASRYESLRASTDEDARRNLGAFFTPHTVVASLTELALEPILATAPVPTVCDPACGDGRFLVEALHCIAAQPGADPSQVAASSIFGVDLDPLAVDLTRVGIWIATGGDPLVMPAIWRNVRQGDALSWGANDTLWSDSMSFDWHREFAHVLGAERFDLVIGNPPWLSHSGRHAVKLEPSRARALRARFVERGWTSTHGMFLQLATELAHRVAFVLPAQVAQLSGYDGVRKQVAESLGLDEVRHLGEDVFDGVTSPVALVLAGGAAPRGVISDARGEIVGSVNPRSSIWHASETPAAGEPFPNGRGSWSLGDLVSDIGVHTGNCSSRLIHPRSADTADLMPILEGRQLSRYGCATATRSLLVSYVPEPGEYRTIRPREAYERIDYCIRQTAAHPIVGPRKGAAYFRNSLLGLSSPRAEHGVSAEFVVAVLNSAPMRAIYEAQVADAGQRAFPQVKIGALRRLPMPVIDRTNERDVRLHDEITSIASRLLELPADDRRFAELDARIDALVEELIA